MKKNIWDTNAKEVGIFIFLSVLVFFFFGYFEIITFPPYSTHQWRQADGLSIALNYYNEGMDFFNPKMHFYESIDGKAVGEFPILYYLYAIVWNIFGVSNASPRIINLIIALCGIFFLFKTTKILIKDKFYSVITPAFIVASPLFGYYAISYLTNVPALSFLFIGWYFLLTYKTNRKIVSVIVSIFFMSLSILLRSTMILGILPIYAIFILEVFGILKNKFFDKKLLNGFLLFLPIIVLILWITFIKQYNSESGSIYFLTQIRPIWSFNFQNTAHIWSLLIHSQFQEMYLTGVLFLFLIAVISVFLITFSKKQIDYISIFTIIVIFELFAYVILWYKNLDVHDYYLIEFYILAPLLLITIFKHLKATNIQCYQSKIFKTLLIIILAISFLYSSVEIRIKYKMNQNAITKIMLSEKEIEFWSWFHWNYNERYKAIETVQPYLRTIGIKRSDIVISLPDISPNISLFFMDQKGFTSLYKGDLSFSDFTENCINKGAIYIIISDPGIYSQEDSLKYLTQPIGKYKNINIYKLK